MFLSPCATPAHKGFFPLAFYMIDLSTIVFMGLTAKPVQSPAMIYCGPKSQKKRFGFVGMVMRLTIILYKNVNNTGEAFLKRRVLKSNWMENPKYSDGSLKLKTTRIIRIDF